MIHLFRNYLLTKVSILVDLLTVFAIVRRKRRVKSFQVKKKEKCEEQISVRSNSILGLSKTKVNSSNVATVLGASKTVIQDFSNYILEEKELPEQSICLSLFNDDDVDLDEEEISLDTINATGVSIQEIERINSMMEHPSSIGVENKGIIKTINALAEVDLFPDDKRSFHAKINTLLDRLELEEEDQDQTSENMELDNLFQ